ncbi:MULTISPECIES: Flp pilus assembly protein CpaB [Variovorax]|uniref:Pilus assembly protein CpaB n=1 Tax=Variovorax guangxiensis TaxID=1775474 RepID=A0A3S0XCJ5_9BURK|nr:Flp pilus assembly protein CpaB [Variovorax guangxiensis]MBB4221697.1 pilus assembly protein CpaB [Variovorax guangxiensis]RUR66253.1 Flp pilus assembly protein CpaB [Variovorax guangxiensis]
MKNIKAIGLILLALLTGLAAAVYAAGWISKQGGIASNKVVVAAVDIELGSRVNPQMLTTIDWPSGSVPNGAFSDIKALDERVVKVGVLRGEAVIEGKLAPVGTQGGLSAVIASGKRAMTVRVNDVVGVAGFALPGNYVDVMVNAQQDKGRGEEALQISKTVLEKVLVLAVAQEANRDDTKPKVVSAVTLELSLEDSEKLDLARSVGTLSLVLRNQMDKTTVATDGITKGQLFGAKELVQVAATAPAPAPARPRAHRPGPAATPASQCVEIIQHAGSSLTCF